MYLIDGNNVIGQRAKGYESWFRDKVGARQQFLRELARLARVVGHVHEAPASRGERVRADAAEFVKKPIGTWP